MAGERGGPQPAQPALPCHPDVAGSARCGPRERHRAHGQRDQPVAAMGGELGGGAGCSGMLSPRVWDEEEQQNYFLFQSSRKSETYLKCPINHLNCLLPLLLPLHQGNICLCVKPWLLRPSSSTLWVNKWDRNGTLEPICSFLGLSCLLCTEQSQKAHTGHCSHPAGTEQLWFKGSKVCALHSRRKIIFM